MKARDWRLGRESEKPIEDALAEIRVLRVAAEVRALAIQRDRELTGLPYTTAIEHSEPVDLRAFVLMAHNYEVSD